MLLIGSAMNRHGLTSSRSRRSKMRNLRVAQIAATLFASEEFCTRKQTRARHAEGMKQVRASFGLARPLSPADRSLVSYFDFIMRLVDIWMPNQEYYVSS